MPSLSPEFEVNNVTNNRRVNRSHVLDNDVFPNSNDNNTSTHANSLCKCGNSLNIKEKNDNNGVEFQRKIANVSSSARFWLDRDYHVQPRPINVHQKLVMNFLS